MNEIITTTGGQIIPQSNNKDLIDRFIAAVDVKPRSRETYRKAAQYILDWLTSKGISQPSREDILEYKRELMSKYKATTVSSYMTATRSFFAWLEAEKVYPNVAAGVKGAKATKGFKKDVLSIDQAKGVLSDMERETLEQKRNYALVNLLMKTGLRTIEAARADISDIRAEAGETLLYIQGKGRDEKDAFVVLTESTYKPIREYLKARGKTAENAPLFASCSDRNNGGRLTTRTISGIAKKALQAAGLDSERLTAHSLRHTAVTLSLIGGATIQEAQALARHSSINTTMIYAHNLDRIARAPERKIDELFKA